MNYLYFYQVLFFRNTSGVSLSLRDSLAISSTYWGFKMKNAYNCTLLFLFSVLIFCITTYLYLPYENLDMVTSSIHVRKYAWMVTTFFTIVCCCLQSKYLICVKLLPQKTMSCKIKTGIVFIAILLNISTALFWNLFYEIWNPLFYVAAFLEYQDAVRVLFLFIYEKFLPVRDVHSFISSYSYAIIQQLLLFYSYQFIFYSRSNSKKT